MVARYSDGTTASAMVNSDGSVRVLFFRGTEIRPGRGHRRARPPALQLEAGRPGAGQSLAARGLAAPSTALK